MKPTSFTFPGLWLLLLLCGFGFAATPAEAAWHRGWDRLGSKTVNHGFDRDEIRCAGEGFMKAIVIEVRQASVNFEDVTIHFGNGSTMDVPLRAVIKRGDRSRVIDLPGEARVIRKIVFRYKTLGRERAKVVVWGRKR